MGMRQHYKIKDRLIVVNIDASFLEMALEEQMGRAQRRRVIGIYQAPKNRSIVIR